MNPYERHVLPYFTAALMGRSPFDGLRKQATAGLHGEVLEVGFGAGYNLPHLPPEVSTLHAIDPDVVGRRLARKRIEAAHCPVRLEGLDGEHLPYDDASMDHVLCTFTLCTIPHPDRALREIRRVLKPGGALHFVEHGLAPEDVVARWQHRLNPLWRPVGGGCNLDRNVPELIVGAELAAERLDEFWWGAKGPLTYMYLGVARKPLT